MHTSKNFLRVAALALTVTGAFACGDPPPPPVAPPPPPPPAPVQEVVVVAPEPIKLPAPVKFATGSAALSPESDAVLQVVAEYMQRSTDTTLLRIEGHTDNVGGTDPNQKLSEGRALSVANWLVAHGVVCRSLLPGGYGETRPDASNDNEPGRAQNRRTVFIAAEIKGRKVDLDPAKGGRASRRTCAAAATSSPARTRSSLARRGSAPTSAARVRRRSASRSRTSPARRSRPCSTSARSPARTARCRTYAFRGDERRPARRRHARKIEFKPGEWIEHPPTFSTVGMIGEVTGDSGGPYLGSICTSPRLPPVLDQPEEASFAAARAPRPRTRERARGPCEGPGRFAFRRRSRRRRRTGARRRSPRRRSPGSARRRARPAACARARSRAPNRP